MAKTAITTGTGKLIYLIDTIDGGRYIGKWNNTGKSFINYHFQNAIQDLIDTGDTTSNYYSNTLKQDSIRWERKWNNSIRINGFKASSKYITHISWLPAEEVKKELINIIGNNLFTSLKEVWMKNDLEVVEAILILYLWDSGKINQITPLNTQVDFLIRGITNTNIGDVNQYSITSKTKQRLKDTNISKELVNNGQLWRTLTLDTSIVNGIDVKLKEEIKSALKKNFNLKKNQININLLDGTNINTKINEIADLVVQHANQKIIKDISVSIKDFINNVEKDIINNAKRLKREGFINNSTYDEILLYTEKQFSSLLSNYQRQESVNFYENLLRKNGIQSKKILNDIKIILDNIKNKMNELLNRGDAQKDALINKSDWVIPALYSSFKNNSNKYNNLVNNNLYNNGAGSGDIGSIRNEMNSVFKNIFSNYMQKIISGSWIIEDEPWFIKQEDSIVNNHQILIYPSNNEKPKRLITLVRKNLENQQNYWTFLWKNFSLIYGEQISIWSQNHFGRTHSRLQHSEQTKGIAENKWSTVTNPQNIKFY